MDFIPLLCIVRATKTSKMPLLFMIQGLLLAVSVISAVSTILVISSISHVDFPVVLLLLCGPLATRLKKWSLYFRILNACVSDCEQIDHYLGLLHGDLLHSLDVVDSVAEGVDDLDVLDIRDNIPGVAETSPPTTFMIDLDELLEIVGPVILVDVPSLEFLWLDNLPERWSQSTKTVPP
jgi:hypothetical protein